MSHIDDVVAGGWWPLRHQATVDAALRYVRMACLVRADAGDAVVGKLTFGRDQLGTIREIDGSAGDVQCGFLWEAKSPVVPFDRAQLNDQQGDPPPRDFPSLGFVFPAIVKESKPLPRESGVPDQTTQPAPPSQSDAAQRRGGGGGSNGDSGLPPIVYEFRPTYSSTGSTTSKPAPPPPPPSVPPPPPLDTHVKVLPIQDEKLTPDARYAELTANTEHGVPTDMPGVIVAATHERRMIPLFFPAHWPLRAVNRNEPTSRASLVFDQDAKGKVDPEIYARLHSAWRVIRLKTVTHNAAPMLNAAADSGQLAWQLAGAGKDGLAGYGLAYDNTGGEAGAAPPPADGTTATATGPGGAPTTPPPPPPPVREFNAQQAASGSTVARLLAATQPKPLAGGTGIGTGTTDGGAGHGTPPETPITTQERRKYSGAIAAYSHTVARGPFDSGGSGCVHKLGETQDGEFVYSGHLHTDSYFRNSSFDGPMNFESRVQSKVDTGPHQMAVHLVWNPNLQHEHPSGTKNGRWWWYAESFDYAVASAAAVATGGTQDSTGVSDGPVSGPKRFPHTWPPTGFPQAPDANTTPVRFEHPGGLPSINPAGTTATAVSTNRNLAAADPKGKAWRASTLLSIGPGFIFRPQDPTPGAPDLRTIKSGAAPLSRDLIKTADLAPTTLRMEAFSRRQRGNWRYGIKKNVSEFAGGTSDIGGLWIGPADRDIQNEMSGQPYVHAPAMDPYFMFHPSMNVGTGGFIQDRFGEGSVDFANFNPAVFMPAATAVDFVPRSDGAGSYSWQAAPGSSGGSAVFGDGSDGAFHFVNNVAAPAWANKISATYYQLIRAPKLTTLIIDAGIKVEMGGFPVYATVSVTINGSLFCSGGDATGVNGGQQGSLFVGYVLNAGAAGPNGSTNAAGAAGANTANAFQTGAGGAGGAATNAGGAAGASTAFAPDSGLLRTWTGIPGSTYTVASGVVSLNGGASGGSGASDNANAHGGGAGAGGGVGAVLSPSILGTGQIYSTGGNGGAGTGTAGNAGGGGGGEGGLITTVGSVAGTLTVVVSGGNGGAGFGTGANGGFGGNGVWVKLGA